MGVYDIPGRSSDIILCHGYISPFWRGITFSNYWSDKLIFWYSKNCI